MAFGVSALFTSSKPVIKVFAAWCKTETTIPITEGDMVTVCGRVLSLHQQLLQNVISVISVSDSGFLFDRIGTRQMLLSTIDFGLSWLRQQV